VFGNVLDVAVSDEIHRASVVLAINHTGCGMVVNKNNRNTTRFSVPACVHFSDSSPTVSQLQPAACSHFAGNCEP